jgi:hypothetical protein
VGLEKIKKQAKFQKMVSILSVKRLGDKYKDRNRSLVYNNREEI